MIRASSIYPAGEGKTLPNFTSIQPRVQISEIVA